ncbi:hypothetical protein RvY_16208 [Ramazzottius varieornatus]|uniref:Receptor ligand binding region domain-containing protein n=1 Tax=Ramazzottius varieornatus TaxID=947166 RepID=A0A1D1VYL1_RAMVA|nr:hypothetical protein RvY_16208 [Ramazzottius varieornatus]
MKLSWFSDQALLTISLFTFASAQGQLRPLQVELILPTTKHPKYPANICEVGPAIKLAVEHVNAQYPKELDLTFKYLEQSEVQSCEDLTSEMGDMLARYYYSPRRERKIAVFGPFDGYNSLAILG